MFFTNINRWRDSRHGQVHDVQRRRQHHVGLPIRGRLLQGGDGGHRLRHTRKVNFQIRHVLENFLGFFTHDNSLLPTINLCYPSKGLCFPIEGFVTQSKAYVAQSKALLPNRRLCFPIKGFVAQSKAYVSQSKAFASQSKAFASKAMAFVTQTSAFVWQDKIK